MKERQHTHSWHVIMCTVYRGIIVRFNLHLKTTFSCICTTYKLVCVMCQTFEQHPQAIRHKQASSVTADLSTALVDGHQTVTYVDGQLYLSE